MDKPHSPSCDRNREPILAVLAREFGDRRRVLEIGSGTGQHAVHFAAAMPWLAWQCSDVADNLPGIRQWLEDARLDNTPPPIVLDVDGDWPQARFDGVFSANTLHIMGWPQVQRCFACLPAVLADDATVAVYLDHMPELRRHFVDALARQLLAWQRCDHRNDAISLTRIPAQHPLHAILVTRARPPGADVRDDEDGGTGVASLARHERTRDEPDA